ncbi:DUF4383 domain-containing protein [Tersicoccus sp. Bi-70]|uniref:DUF4383 domain-containing protein n=1 Tax=Tersicoccus sp. Bi-70 TaxID=1897634 RepID=UPI0009F92329
MSSNVNRPNEFGDHPDDPRRLDPADTDGPRHAADTGPEGQRYPDQGSPDQRGAGEADGLRDIRDGGYDDGRYADDRGRNTRDGGYDDDRGPNTHNGGYDESRVRNSGDGGYDDRGRTTRDGTYENVGDNVGDNRYDDGRDTRGAGAAAAGAPAAARNADTRNADTRNADTRNADARDTDARDSRAEDVATRRAGTTERIVKERTRASRGIARTVAAIIAVVFLVVGVLGFIPGITSNVDQLTFAGHSSGALLLGIFQVSVLHNIVHLAFGVVGLLMSRTAGAARTFLIGGGIIYLVLWVLGLLFGHVDTLNVVPVNDADNWLHLGLGVVMVLLGLIVGRRRTVSREIVG